MHLLDWITPQVSRLRVALAALAPACVLGAAEPAVTVRIQTGEISGARFAIMRQPLWNGKLLLVARSARPVDAPLAISLDPKREPYRTLLAEGWMVAATSYRRSGIIIADAIDDLDALRAFVAGAHGTPTRVIVEGSAMGGLIATLMAERVPRIDGNGRADYSGAIAIDASLSLPGDRTGAGIVFAPKMPLLFVTNQGEIEPTRRYVTSPQLFMGNNVIPALFRVSRDGHLNVNPAERLAAIRAMDEWISNGRESLPQPENRQPFFDITRTAGTPHTRATPHPDGRGLEATVLQVTPTSGSIEAAATMDDMEAAGIAPMVWFQLRVGDRTFRTRYGRDLDSVERGEWVALANEDGTLWIARNTGNAALTAGVKAGDRVSIVRY